MNKDREEIKMPLSVMLDMAKMEIGEHIDSCMRVNHIPTEMMIMVLKEIILDLNTEKINHLSSEFADIIKTLKNSEENKQEE